MKVIDAHLHVDDKISNDLKTCLEKLDEERKLTGIEKCVVLHLETQKWSLEEYSKIIPLFPNLIFFANVHPYKSNALEILEQAIKNFGFKGLKLHPRLNQFKVDDPRVIKLVQKAGELNIPMLIDAFPDGNFLMEGFDYRAYSNLALACPSSKMIWAHSGGQHCLDFMMMCRRLPNVYMDISYTYLYFRGSAVTQNMNYVMRSMRFKKLFYGSDYPDRSLKETLDLTLNEMEQIGLTESEKSAILYDNFKDFLGI
jgi:predicted TIM-barrel fold metal-dependent hydrolase